MGLYFPAWGSFQHLSINICNQYHFFDILFSWVVVDEYFSESTGEDLSVEKVHWLITNKINTLIHNSYSNTTITCRPVKVGNCCTRKLNFRWVWAIDWWISFRHKVVRNDRKRNIRGVWWTVWPRKYGYCFFRGEELD